MPSEWDAGRHRHAGRDRAGLARSTRSAARRPQAREQAQASYRALFAPEDPGELHRDGAFRGRRLRHRPARRRGDRVLLRRAASPPAGPRPTCAVRSTRRSRRPRRKVPMAPIPAGPLSREDTAGPIYRVSAGDPPRAGGTALRGARPHAPAGVPPARCRAGGAAGPARCRLVDHRHRDAVADRRVPVVPDPGRRRLARPGRRLTRTRFGMTDTVLEPPPPHRARRLHPGMLDWLPWLEPLAAEAS